MNTPWQRPDCCGWDKFLPTTAGNWGQVAKLTAADASPDDWFGATVALKATTVLIGVGLDDDSGSNSGSVYIFSIDKGPILQIPTAIPASTNPVDVPVNLTNNGATLGSMAFSINYDEIASTSTLLTPMSTASPMPSLSTHQPTLPPPSFSTLATPTERSTSPSQRPSCPPTPLVDGEIVTLTFTPKPHCIPNPPATTLAPVAFSSDPSASFGDLDAQSIAGTTEDGSVEIFGGTRGDCNGDGMVDAADLFACTLELFDGDGNVWIDAPGGTFTGLPVGCDEVTLVFARG